MPRKSSTSSSYGPLLLISIGVVVIIIVILTQAIASNLPSNPSSTQANNDIPRTSLSEAKKAFDNGSAIFLDVRDVEFFQDEHIKGAVNLPYGDIDAKFRQLDANRWIITYCT